MDQEVLNEEAVLFAILWAFIAMPVLVLCVYKLGGVLRAKLRERYRWSRRCPGCGYDMRDLRRCPECGRPAQWRE